EKCDFVTGAGFLSGRAERRATGVRGGGPHAVVTDLGILTPDEETGELVLTRVHPGATAEQAVKNTGWPLRVATDLQTTEPPTDEELQLLREELDPTGIYVR
ncbi:MAG TPA: CoA-transferase subunit beta, partial [Anaerolineae bacterium]|nr:CoA-transferase subunit beta [Anaerolineae bacterium]